MHEDHPQGLFYWFIIMFCWVKTPKDELENLEIHQGLVSLIISMFFTCLSSLLYILWDGCITCSERHQEKCIEIMVSHINILVCVHRRIFREEKLQILYHATFTELVFRRNLLLNMHVRNLIDENRKKLKQRKTWRLFVSKTIYWISAKNSLFQLRSASPLCFIRMEMGIVVESTLSDLIVVLMIISSNTE